MSGTGFVSVHFFHRDADCFAALSALLDQLAGRPGFRGGELGVGTEQPDTVALLTRWDGAGWYRRALGAADVRPLAVALLARAEARPGSFEVLTDR